MNEEHHSSQSPQLATTEEAGDACAGDGQGITNDGEVSTPIPSPHQDSQPTSTASVNNAVAAAAAPKESADKLILVAGDGNTNADAEGLGIGIETIGDEEAPFHPHHFEDIKPKKLKMKGSVEQIPDSAPFPDEFAALAHNDLLKMKGSYIQPVPILPPIPDALAVLAHDHYS